MTADVMTTLGRRRASGRGGAFTLTELLVVISIIVAMLTMAMPLFNAMTGSRSIESAQNKVSSFLQRARARAIGLQEKRGVLFFNDTQTGQVAMAMVREGPIPGGTNPAVPLEIDEDSTEAEFFPPGVGVAFYSPNVAGTLTNGLNPRVNGVVMFDGLGRLQTTRSAHFPPGALLSEAYATRAGGGLTSLAEWSSTAMMLYDKANFGALPASATPDQTFSPEQVTWLNQNATVLVVSRYNGTLARGD
jgi:type II secretory pathway pseudopilin PulG